MSEVRVEVCRRTPAVRRHGDHGQHGAAPPMRFPTRQDLDPDLAHRTTAPTTECRPRPASGRVDPRRRDHDGRGHGRQHLAPRPHRRAAQARVGGLSSRQMAVCPVLDAPGAPSPKGSPARPSAGRKNGSSGVLERECGVTIRMGTRLPAPRAVAAEFGERGESTPRRIGLPGDADRRRGEARKTDVALDRPQPLGEYLREDRAVVSGDGRSPSESEAFASVGTVPSPGRR